MTLTTHTSASKAVANLAQIQLAPHIAAVVALAIAARPKENPPVETFQAFQILCGHIEPDLLTVGMAECLQRFKYGIPSPADVSECCDFIQQLVDERGMVRRLKSYGAQNKADAKAFDLAEFKRRMLPQTLSYIEQRRADVKPSVAGIDADAHNREMLDNALARLAVCSNPEQREYLETSVSHYRARIGAA